MFIANKSDFILNVEIEGSAICTEGEEFNVSVVVTYEEMGEEDLVDKILAGIRERYPYYYRVTEISLWLDDNAKHIFYQN